ncbi:dipeptidase [Vibrio superstes]|uniref:Dipeptidase n=1 Tax=Vibrio superstes NBRC 103154 TaxID=1219062 RepID=A0A511QTA5_9VIBR|nr:membrane dipeptidase [Vibrio superstes]GEM80561.1 hypothetical protein VSU01S_28060 [Vibrio superstes NBRC 103154]
MNSRRNFLKGMGATSVGVVAAVVAPKIIATTRHPSCDDMKVLGVGSAPVPTPQNDPRGFKYFGPNANAKHNTYPVHARQAVMVDFGLSAKQEEEAQELYRECSVYDAEFEVDYYREVFANMQANEVGFASGSMSMDAFPAYYVNNRSGDERQIEAWDWWTRESLDKNLMFWRDEVQKHHPEMMLCHNHADLMTAKRLGKVGMMMDTQNSLWIGQDERQVKKYKDLGIHRCQIAYNSQTLMATGCYDAIVSVDAGLTDWGRRMIGEMNEVGMLVDTGHSSTETLRQAIEVSERPIICSHAGVRDWAPNSMRTHNLADIKKLADTGGVFGLVGVTSTFVDMKDMGAFKDNVSHMVEAMHKLINEIGSDSLGFALDQVQAMSWEELTTAPDWSKEAVAAIQLPPMPLQDQFVGMDNHSGYFNLCRGLLAKGHSHSTIKKVLGGNMIRLIKEEVK